jgi:hypothetical protein
MNDIRDSRGAFQQEPRGIGRALSREEAGAEAKTREDSNFLRAAGPGLCFLTL